MWFPPRSFHYWHGLCRTFASRKMSWTLYMAFIALKHSTLCYSVENSIQIRLSTYLPGNPTGFSRRYVRVGDSWRRKLWVFPVQVGVKQGCVLAPVISNIFMSAVALYARNSSSKTMGSPSSIALMATCSNNVVSMPNPKHLLPILMSFSMLMRRH